MDVDTIAPGSDFAEAIDRAVSQCDAVVAVIGRHWLDAALPDGRRRLDEPQDFVRLELESALANGVSVIPTAVQGAAFPDASSLPATLEPLAGRQGIELRDTAWRDDVQRLVRRLEPENTRPRSRRRLLLLGGVAVAVAAIVAAVLAITQTSGGGSSPSARADPQLVAAVPGGISFSCKKPDGGVAPESAIASVECDGDSNELSVIYNRFASAGVANSWFEQEREKARVLPSTGTCIATAFHGAATRGDAGYFCYLDNEGHPVLEWTDPRLKIGATAFMYQGTGKGAAKRLLHQWKCCYKLKHEALPSALQRSQ